MFYAGSVLNVSVMKMLSIQDTRDCTVKQRGNHVVSVWVWEKDLSVCVCEWPWSCISFFPLIVCRFTAVMRHWEERGTDLPTSNLFSFRQNQTQTFYLQTLFLSHTHLCMPSFAFGMFFLFASLSLSHTFYEYWIALFRSWELNLFFKDKSCLH